jgi:predicted ribosome-associated RNA-binding protein Tma20
MARKKKASKPEIQVFVDKKAVQKIVEGLTELLMGVITGNDNLTTNKEIDVNGQPSNDTSNTT